jgi:hypothetical protein
VRTPGFRYEPGPGRLGLFDTKPIGLLIFHFDGGAESHGGESFVGQGSDEIVDGKGCV